MGFQHCRQGPNTLHHNPSCYRKPTEMLQNRYRTAKGSDVILRDHRYFQVCAGEMRNGKRLKTFRDNLQCKPAQLDYGGKGNRKYGLRNNVKLSLHFVKSLNLHFQLAQKLKNSEKKTKHCSGQIMTKLP